MGTCSIFSLESNKRVTFLFDQESHYKITIAPVIVSVIIISIMFFLNELLKVVDEVRYIT